MSHVSYEFTSDEAYIEIGTASPYPKDVADLCVIVGNLRIEALAAALADVAKHVKESDE